MRVQKILKNLFPQGTVGGKRGISSCPVWPVDLFAATATVMELSGTYTLATDLMADQGLHRLYLDKVCAISRKWIDDPLTVPAEAQRLWKDVVSGLGPVEVSEVGGSPAWQSLMILFAVADDVCAGIGWGMSTERETFFVALALHALGADYHRNAKVLPYAPHSLCLHVPDDRAVVLPKSIASSVGCTIRSLSHNLALLPAVSSVRATWQLGGKKDTGTADTRACIRLLVLPYPFSIPTDSVVRCGTHASSGVTPPEYFDLEQKWLEPKAGAAITAQTFFHELLRPLLDRAREECEAPIHGVVIPECALSEKISDDLSKILSGVANDYGIEFFIVGVLGGASKDKVHTKFKRVRNLAKTIVFSDGPKGPGAVTVTHAKHHRWCLDKSQVARYRFEKLLPSNGARWWENIDVSRRELPFVAVRRDVSLSVLICEDLARSDPAMPVIRAIGPNLLIALLMDGPQLASRWPGRYAMGLADDPGSSVLTVTCAGMVDRSNESESAPKRVIGLWRDASGQTREIHLPKGALGVVLSLQPIEDEQRTMDNRSDNKTTTRLELFGSHAVTVDSVPKWV
ncbi:hypothetical protein [Burkholderia ubonensis]|uniref:hypothetical protein n=1 Tax=Burkholderia ubonensis TaxID=101571 RepID=UPI000AE4DD08|nr:hypothetical protein [Burkholderia ubonensis]